MSQGLNRYKTTIFTYFSEVALIAFASLFQIIIHFSISLTTFNITYGANLIVTISFGRKIVNCYISEIQTQTQQWLRNTELD